MRRLSAAAFAVCTIGCTDPTASLGDLVDGGAQPPVLLYTSPPRGIDILVVIDNTASMAEEQGALAAALAPLVESLAAVTDVRIGFTTTDNGNPGCIGTSPEAGALEVTSCQARVDQFVGDAPGPDVIAVGCTDGCGLEGFEIIPTHEGFGSVAKPRPWIESIAGVPNVSVGLGAAVACAAPQGILGCEFGQPLESMRNAVKRSMQVGEPSEGFIRPDAALAVIVLTDAADCSHDPAWQEIFAPEGDRVFWSDAAQATATPAVCWNAGVSCTGGDSDAFAECTAADKTLTGGPAGAGEAVLYPLSRYEALFAEIAADKSAYLAEPPIALYVFAGVPSGYQSGVSSLRFPRDADPATLAQSGIGSACDGGSGPAVPTVRLRQLLADEGGALSGRVASVCDLDYGAAMAELGAPGKPDLSPLCYFECAADLDLASGGLQPACTVTQTRGSPDGRITVTVPACGGIPAAPEIPDGSDVCWYPRIDRVGSTPEAVDDVAAACLDEGTNLQLQIVRAGGTLEPGGTATLAWCEPDPACP